MTQPRNTDAFTNLNSLLLFDSKKREEKMKIAVRSQGAFANKIPQKNKLKVYLHSDLEAKDL